MTEQQRAGGRSAVLLDLDGTVCLLFAHTDLDPLRARVAALLRFHGLGDLAEGDVFTVAARVAAARAGDARAGGGDALVEEIDALLTGVELRAADTAPLVAGAEEVITGWVAAGRPVAVVTNNSPACVGRLARRCLPALARVPVVGRDPRHPGHAKPDPWGIRRALALLGGGTAPDPGSARMVGDSLSDLEAARAAGCGFIGMGSTPAKRSRLEAAVPSGAVVTDFHHLRERLA